MKEEIFKKVKRLIEDIRLDLIVSHKIIVEGNLFHLNDIVILTHVFESIDKNTYEFGTSTFILANELWMSEQEVDQSLKRLSNYSLITCQAETTERRRLNYQIKLNPTIYGIIMLTGFTKSYKQIISHIVKFGIRRKYKFETPMQGFRIDTLFGEYELESEPYNAEKEILKIAEEQSIEKKKREEDVQSWRALSNEFVKGCSTIWVIAQSAQGNGSALPNWALDDCPTKVRAERNELIKTFKNYGGRVTALTWMLFCGGITEVDENGRIKYSITCPHRQFVTSDKKPSQFTKNFNSLLKDPILHEWANNEWICYYPLLKEHYGSSLDTLPKQGDEFILSGLKFQKNK